MHVEGPLVRRRVMPCALFLSRTWWAGQLAVLSRGSRHDLESSFGQRLMTRDTGTELGAAGAFG